MCKPHKHAAIIKAWAEGSVIEVRYFVANEWTPWCDWSSGIWETSPRYEYRVKPEKKDDIIQYFNVAPQVINLSLKQYANAKCTFDGETGKLKAVELI